MSGIVMIVRRLHRLLAIVMTLIALGAFQNSRAESGSTLAKQPIWSEQIDFDQISDIDTADNSTGYLVGSEGLVLITRNKGTTWRHVDTKPHKRILQVYAGAQGVVIATTADSYLYSNDYGNTWKETAFTDEYVARSVGYSHENGDVVWRLEFKQRSVEGKNGAVRVAVSTDRGHTWNNSILIPYLPHAIKPVDEVTSWGYDEKRLYQFTNAGQTAYVIEGKLSRGEKFVRGGVLNDAFIVASSTGRIFKVTIDRVVASLERSPAERLGKFFLYPNGSAAAIDATGKIYESRDVEVGDWRVAGSYSSVPTIIFGWPNGGFLSKSSTGDVGVRKISADTDRIVFDVPRGSPFRVTASNKGLLFFATEKGEVFRSIDNGLNWKRCFEDTIAIKNLSANANGYAVISNEEATIYSSQDSGSTWHELEPLPVTGIVGRLFINDRNQIAVEISDGYYPYAESKLFIYNQTTKDWGLIGVSTGMRLLGEIPGGEIRGLQYDGSIATWKSESTWVTVSSNLMELLKRRLPEETTSNIFMNWFWINSTTGWVSGEKGLFYRTEDAGESWEDLSLPINAEIKYLHFFDASNGLIYGNTSDGLPQSVEYYATTNDGGKSWISHNSLGTGDFSSLSIAQDGTGVVNMKSGVVHIKKIEDIAVTSVSTEQSLFGKITYTMDQYSGKERVALPVGAISKATLWYRIGDDTNWVSKTIQSNEIQSTNLQQAKFQWSPSESIIDITPGEKIETKVTLHLKSGEITLTTNPIEYLSWVIAYKESIKKIMYVAGAVLLYLAVFLLIMLLNPTLIVRIASKRRNWLAEVSEFLPGALKSVMVVIAKISLVDNLAKSNRAMRAWTELYRKYKVKFSDLNEDILNYYIEQPDLMDVWVAHRLESCRTRLQSKREQFGISVYVPMGVQVSSKAAKTRIDIPSSRSLREHLNFDRAAVGIIGEGGIGKTALVGQLAEWATREDADERLLEHTALSILLHGDITDVLKATRDELLTEYVEQDPAASSAKVLEAALRQRRIILFFDGLSESSPSTQKMISHIFADIKMGLLIITARKSYPHILARWIQISPDQVAPESVNRFLSQYIHEKSLDMEITPREQLALSEQLLRLLEGQAGKTTLPPVFLVLFIESLRAEPNKISGPTTLASTVQRYVRSLRPPADHPLSDPELFASLAATLAVVSLQPNFIPSEFDFEKGEEALSKVKLVDNPGDVIMTMISANLLIERMGVSGRRVRFRLDPVAEYLAAIRNTKKFGSIELWQEHLTNLTTFHKIQGDTQGYVIALMECIQSIGKEYYIPEWMYDRLQELIAKDIPQRPR